MIFLNVKTSVFFFYFLCRKCKEIIVEVKVAQVCSTLCNPMDYTVHGILQPEYWSGQPFPSSGYLPNPGIEPRSPALEADSLPAEMATHSSILAWKIPWTEEAGRLQSMGSQRVRHNLVMKPPPHYYQSNLSQI